MALRFYGKAENDPGEWVRFGDSEVKVRRIPVDKAREIGKRYGREVMREHEGVRRPDIERTRAESEAHLIDLAATALVDVRGPSFEIVPEDEEGAAKMRAVLRDPSIHVGEAVRLEGKLTSFEMKQWLIRDVKPETEWDRDEYVRALDDIDIPKGRYVDLGSLLIFASRRAQLTAVKAEEARQGNS